MLPVGVRRSLGIKDGDTLSAKIVNDQLVISSRQIALKRLREKFSSVAQEGSITDELIADRRKEAARDLDG